ncbi:MAG TPA: divalent metal cation transporter, partial [Actinomycetota bacterium]
LLNLFASFIVNLLTLAAEIGGIALAVELLTGINYLIWVPPAALLVWLVLWRMRFQLMENLFGLAGLALLVVVVALWRYHPDWGGLLHGAVHPAVPRGEGHPTYWYYAIALLGSAMTPYEVFFFSSGAVEEGWSSGDLLVNRMNVYLGFPLGGALALALMVSATLFLEPRGIDPSHLSQAALPVALVLGRVGLAFAIFAFFVLTFGAALETGLSSGYTIAQYFGWQWGKYVKPAEAARFHLVMLASVVTGALLILTTIDPIKLTEYTLVLSAAALPLTYFPILVVANDPDYMGSKVNSRFTNAAGSVLLVILVVTMLAAGPLMIVTKAGQ